MSTNVEIFQTWKVCLVHPNVSCTLYPARFTSTYSTCIVGGKNVQLFGLDLAGLKINCKNITEINQLHSTGLQKQWPLQKKEKKKKSFYLAKKDFLASNPIEMHLPDTATIETHNIYYRITAPLQKDPAFNCDRRPKYLGTRKLLFFSSPDSSKYFYIRSLVQTYCNCLGTI